MGMNNINNMTVFSQTADGNKQPKQVIVYTAGVWDMFHIGHLRILESAKALGDILIVGVNTDELVKEYKGHYPLLPWQERAAIVKACRYVDMVVPSVSLEKDELLENLNIDILVHGDDKKVMGHDYMIRNNKKVVYLPYTQDRSSSKIRKMLTRYYHGIGSVQSPDMHKQNA